MTARIKTYLNNLNYRRINFLLSLLLYFILEYSFRVFISKAYHIYAYSYEMHRYLTAKLIYLIVLIFVNRIKSPFIYVMTYIFLILMLAPNLILYQYMKFDFRIIIVLVFFFLYMSFLGSFQIKQHWQIKFFPQHKAQIFLLFAVLLIIPYFMTYGFHFNFSVFTLDDSIYAQRSKANSKAGVYILYTMGWLAKVILPILLIITLQSKKRIMIIITLVLMVYLFVTMSHKVMLIGPIAVLGFYYVSNTKAQISIILLGLLSILIFSRFLTEFMNYNNLEGTFVNRLFFVPAILNHYYFEFFDGNPQYLSNSVLSGFIDYKYSLQPRYLIGKVYWDSPNTSANNGFVSDGFLHFGYIGSFVFSILLGGIIKLFDSLRINSRYNGVFLISMFTFTSSAFFTNLLTHGILLLILLSYLFLQNTEKEFSG